MKKNMKKLVSLLLTLVMVFAMSAAVFAEGENFTITIEENDKAPDKYEAYQIFKGDLSESVLSNIEWGKNVDSTKIEALQTELDVTSASDAAEKLAAGTISATVFADAVAKCLTGAPIANEGNKITVPKADAGYYLIKNQDGTATDGKAYTKFVLKVVKDTSFKPKADAPEVEKQVKNADEIAASYRDANNIGVGDIMNYQITSKVPDMSKYEQYYFIMNDTMSEGIDYVGNMSVTVGGKTLTPTDNAEDTGETYKLTVVKNEDGTTSLKIVFSNFIQYKELMGQAVTVTYDAKLNENALTVDVNNNNVDLTYSNNPNKQGTGKNEPGEDEDDVTGITPKEWTNTYTTNLGLFKYDGADKKALEGVEFTLTGLKNNDKVKVVQEFTAAEDGTYYKLKDGSYTDVEPNEKNAKCYDSTTQKYKMTVTQGTYTESVDKVTITKTTDANGFVDFGSLPAGEYELVEIKTADGYNMLTAPIKITITCNSNDLTVIDGTEEVTWTVEGADGAIIEGAQGAPATISVKNIVNVANNQGSTLPETGGMGTRLFYLVGCVLVLGAGVLLIAKRRTER